MSIKKIIRWLLGFVLLAFIICFVIPACFVAYWGFASPDRTCFKCHGLGDREHWAVPKHQEIDCRVCHKGRKEAAFHGIDYTVHAFFGTSEEFSPETAHLDELGTIEMMGKCKECHEDKYADWEKSKHSATYAVIFFNEELNRSNAPNVQCMKCHGMFFDANIDNLVQPLDTEGPWKFPSEYFASRHAIPCLACHQIHPDAIPDTPDDASPSKVNPVSLGFYDRNEKLFFDIDSLPDPIVWEGAQQIEVSDDKRQRICVQCHANDSFHQPERSDDRTPRGIHKGISCLTCHDPHTNETRGSCNTCHEQPLNCGLDVEKMDTTYANPDSKNDIHFIECSSCHAEAPGTR